MTTPEVFKKTQIFSDCCVIFLHSPIRKLSVRTKTINGLPVEQLQYFSYCFDPSLHSNNITSHKNTCTHTDTHTHIHTSVGPVTRFNWISQVCWEHRQLMSWNILHSRILFLTSSYRYSTSCCNNNFKRPTLWTGLAIIFSYRIAWWSQNITPFLQSYCVLLANCMNISLS